MGTPQSTSAPCYPFASDEARMERLFKLYEKMTAELTKIYGEVLGIAADRMYIKYMGSYDWGWNGSNF